MCNKQLQDVWVTRTFTAQKNPGLIIYICIRHDQRWGVKQQIAGVCQCTKPTRSSSSNSIKKWNLASHTKKLKNETTAHVGLSYCFLVFNTHLHGFHALAKSLIETPRLRLASLMQQIFVWKCSHKNMLHVCPQTKEISFEKNQPKFNNKNKFN